MNTILWRSLVVLIGLAAIFPVLSDSRKSSVTPNHDSFLLQKTRQQTGTSYLAAIDDDGEIFSRTELTQVVFRPATQVSVPDLMKNPLTHSDVDKANSLVGSIKASEWLGPLAPIAISPFFGVTILAGLAQFGGDWLPTNEFISNNAVLKNPTVFWVFLALTVLTSIPRFTKVSKPAAQAIDQLETYAGIITIVLLRVMMMSNEPSLADSEVALQAGVFSMTADTLMCVAAVINIIVINTVKFFFEVSVWLIPFPFVDALLEVANKTACAGLMAVYAYNPFVATILNLVIFGACLIAFKWIYRRTVYLRNMLLDPVIAIAMPSYGVPKKKRLTVFNKERLGPFAPKSRLMLSSQPEGWKLTEQHLLLPGKSLRIDTSSSLVLYKGVLGNHLQLSTTPDDNDDSIANSQLVFSRRYSGNIEQLAELLGVQIAEAGDAPGVSSGDLNMV